MLELNIPKTRMWKPKENLFVYIEPETLTLEHSLISISKWESKWHRAFIDKSPDAESLSGEQLLSYLRCMTIGKAKDPNSYYAIASNPDLMGQVNAYIDDPMTATVFYEDPNGKSKGVGKTKTTSEEIYHSMIKWGIPFDCEKWHINRLLTLINVFVEKENPRKMSKREILERNNAIRNKRHAEKAKRGVAKRRP